MKSKVFRFAMVLSVLLMACFLMAFRGGCSPEPEIYCATNTDCSDNFFCDPDTASCRPLSVAKWCAEDADCTYAATDCCGCQNGGISIAVNTSHAALFPPPARECQDVACSYVMLCPNQPVCLDNQCTDGPSFHDIYGCARDEDCTWGKTDCCGCQADGESTPVNVRWKDYLAPPAEQCQDVVCGYNYTCPGNPVCEQGFCGYR